MTQAADQIAINPCPPADRLAGSAGQATSVEVAIPGSDGNIVTAGEKGDVAIRSDNIKNGYRNKH